MNPRTAPRGGGRWRRPSGDYLDFDPGDPDADKRKWESKDHWHWNKDDKNNPDRKKHYKPGEDVPDPAPACKPRTHSQEEGANWDFEWLPYDSPKNIREWLRRFPIILS